MCTAVFIQSVHMTVYKVTYCYVCKDIINILLSHSCIYLREIIDAFMSIFFSLSDVSVRILKLFMMVAHFDNLEPFSRVQDSLKTKTKDTPHPIL